MGFYQKNVIRIIGAWSLYGALCAGAIYAWIAPELIWIAIILTAATIGQLLRAGLTPYVIIVDEDQIRVRSFFMEKRVPVDDIRHIDINVKNAGFGNKKCLRLTLKDCSEVSIQQLGGQPLASMYQAISGRWRNTQVIEDSPVGLRARTSTTRGEMLRRPPAWRSLLRPMSLRWRARACLSDGHSVLPVVDTRIRRPFSRPLSSGVCRRHLQPIFRAARSRHATQRRGRIREVLIIPAPKSAVVSRMPKRSLTSDYKRWKRLNKIWNLLIVIVTILVVLFIIVMYRHRSASNTGNAGEVFDNMLNTKGLEMIR